MNEKDRKEIQAYDDYIQRQQDLCDSYAKKGIMYGSASHTDMVLCVDEVERRIDNGESFENFIPEMIKIGYEIDIFMGDLN